MSETLTDSYGNKPKTHYIHGQWPPQWQPDTLTTQQNHYDYQLGNRALPVASYREHIVDTILDNQFTVITSATGSGKTTQVPQYLYEEGYNVIVTQPRIMAARTNSERIREELEDIVGPIGTLVGYRTKEEGDSTQDTKILLCTDGLQVMHELMEKRKGKKTVAVFDEIHERNHNMDLLLALAKRRAAKDPDFRSVIMSATVDVERYSEFLKDTSGKPAPIIDIPGKTFEIAEVQGGDVYDEAVKYGSMGLNVALIVPGIEDIKKAISKISRQLPSNVTILPLYRDQTIAEQQRVMQSYPNGKIIVATNVLRSSLTVPDLDVMVGCGWERTSDTARDVHGTYVRPTSRSSEDQERGRVGRTKFGIYVHGLLDGYPPLPPREERDLYDKPEITRMRLDGTILKLARVALSLDDLDFMDPIEQEAIDGATNRLRRIGALALDGSITDIGNDMAFIPIDPHHARMLIASRSQSYRVRQQMLAAIAVQQENGIASTDPTQVKRWKKLSTESQSDILMHLDTFIAALDMTEEELYQNGIVPKKLYRAFETFFALSEREGIAGIELESPDETQRAALIECILAGSDELYMHKGKNQFRDPRGRRRKISKRSAMSRSHKRIVVGAPFDLQKMTERGGRMRRFILGATVVNPELLVQVAPDRCDYEDIDYTVDKDGKAKVRKALYFDGLDTRSQVLADAEPSAQYKEFLINTLVQSSYKQLQYNNTAKLQRTFIRLRELQRRSLQPIDIDTAMQLVTENLMEYIPDTVRSLGEVDAYMPEYTVDMFVPPELEAEILKSSPNHITIKGFKLPVRYSRGDAYIDIPAKLSRSIPESIPELGERTVYIRTPKGKDYHLLKSDNVVSIAPPVRQRQKQDAQTETPHFAKIPMPRGHDPHKSTYVAPTAKPLNNTLNFNRASNGRR